MNLQSIYLASNVQGKSSPSIDFTCSVHNKWLMSSVTMSNLILLFIYNSIRQLSKATQCLESMYLPFPFHYVVTNLQPTCSNAVPTTCQQDVFALLVPSLMTYKLSTACWQLATRMLSSTDLLQVVPTTCYRPAIDSLVATWWNNSIVTTCWQAVRFLHVLHSCKKRPIYKVKRSHKTIKEDVPNLFNLISIITNKN
jgi:hypothetical protein